MRWQYRDFRIENASDSRQMEFEPNHKKLRFGLMDSLTGLPALGNALMRTPPCQSCKITDGADLLLVPSRNAAPAGLTQSRSQLHICTP